MAEVETATIIDSEGVTRSIRTKAGAYKSSVTITRPANTTGYTANDVYGAAAAALEFTSIGPAGGHILIRSAIIMVEASALIASEAGYALHFYDVSPPSALADNAAFDVPSGDRDSYLGSTDLGTPVDIGASLYKRTDGLTFRAKLAASSTSLFAYLVTAGGYVPTASRVIRATLLADGI